MTIKFNCDCGFSWEKGRSGQHNCSPFYRETIGGQQQEITKQKLNRQMLLKSIILLTEDSTELSNKNTAQEVEISELKSMVETLRVAATLTDKEFRHHAKVESFETTVLSEALAKTEKQS